MGKIIAFHISQTCGHICAQIFCSQIDTLAVDHNLMALCKDSISASVTGLVHRRYHKGGMLASYNQLQNVYHSVLPAINQTIVLFFTEHLDYITNMCRTKKTQLFVAKDIK